MNKKIVILGASGFIGREVSRLFIEKKQNVLLYSRHGSRINSLIVESIDITKKWSLLNRLKDENIRTIIDLAAKVPQAINKSSQDLFLYNLRIIKEVIESWSRLRCHLIYSSALVYGNIYSPWKEHVVPIPDNYYSLSKFMGEELLGLNAEINSLPLTILRINAPFGRENRRKTVINTFIEQALAGKDITVFGSGKRQQDFIHVSDVAKAVWLAFKKKKSGVYNVASGMTISMLQLARLIKKLTKSKSKIVTHAQADPQEKRMVEIAISKSRRELGFYPALSLEDGLRECILEYQINNHGYRYNS